MNLLFKHPQGSHSRVWIKVIGVGGGGGNAISLMMKYAIRDVELIVCDTDAMALSKSCVPVKVQIGKQLTRAPGVGTKPEIGRKAAMEDAEVIRAMLKGADLVFITAGMGGGTGTGAAPIIADIAKKLGIVVLAIVTKPFAFEGQNRGRWAENGLKELFKVDCCILTISNQRLLALADTTPAVREAFQLADMALYNAVRGITEIITLKGLVGVDFADVKTVLCERGHALMGIGVGTGENCGREAARKAMHSSLLDDTSIGGARGIMINVTGGKDLNLFDVNDAAMEIQKEMHEDANITFGAVIDESLRKDEVNVTVIANGFPVTI